MLSIIRTGTACLVQGGTTTEMAKASSLLGNTFRYRMKGYEFAPSFNAGRWDGYIRLVRSSRSGLRFPGGLFRETVALFAFHDLDCEIIDRRPDPPAIPAMGRWGGESDRHYQAEAAEKAFLHEDGLLHMAIRSGKTHTASRIIQAIQKKALFVVPSQLLLVQTAKAVQENLPDASVTRVGDGDNDFSGDVVVATIQSLMGKTDLANDFSFGVAVFDECHHASGGAEWLNAMLSISARHKFGLSATIDFPTRGGVETNTIWIRAICGPVVATVTMDQLIEWGYLTRPVVRFTHYDAPHAGNDAWTPKHYGDLIVDCTPRNRAIVEAVVPHAKAGQRVLVDASRVRHCRILLDLIRKRLPPGKVALMTGKVSAKERAQILDAFRFGQTPVVVGNILGEGVDIPELEVVVNAEGGRAKETTIQRLRNMTLSEGKTQAVIYEMVDVHHKTLGEWTEARYKTYVANKTFEIDEGTWT